MNDRDGKLLNVEAGRGVAAALVVLFHTTNYYFSTPKYWSGEAFHQFFLFGHAGVEYFFVLSGFIMVWVHRRDVGNPKRVGAFAWKRFRRIYPFFWVVLGVTLLLVWKFPMLGKPFYRDPAIVAQSFALVGQDPLHAVVFVSWTLWHEMVFYAVCAIVIAAPRVGIPVFLVWTAGCAAMQFTNVPTIWPSYMTAFINVLFAFGAGVGLGLQRWSLPMPGAAFCIGVTLFLGTGLVLDYAAPLPEWSTHLVFGISSAFILAGAVELERAGRLSAPRWMAVLGASSFSIYLTHILSLTLIAKVASVLDLPRFVPAPLAFLAMVAIAVCGGIAVHYIVEVRVLSIASAIRARVLGRRPASAERALR